MKVAILAGGLGTRLAEETVVKPKPMVHVGHQPILWHIMKHYAHWGHDDFFVALGYKGSIIKRYFMDYHVLSSNMTIDLSSGKIDTHKAKGEDWKVTLIDTGTNTNTGGRVRRLRDILGAETFMLTYGDGVADIDVSALIDLHKRTGKLATITAVRPPARFGGIVFDGDTVAQFTEKPQIGEGWINGGFMVCEPEIFEYIKDDSSSLEADMLENLAANGQLAAYKHEGFWQCMDTLRDKRQLQQLWSSGQAPWKVW